MSNVFNLFLHVTFAILGLVFWGLGIALLYIMRQNERILELGKFAATSLIIGGIFFTLMQFFGSLTYSPYGSQISGFLKDEYPFWKGIFDYKLLLVNTPATLMGFGAAACAWVASGRRDVTLSLIFSVGAALLFLVALVFAVLVTTTYSV